MAVTMNHGGRVSGQVCPGDKMRGLLKRLQTQYDAYIALDNAEIARFAYKTGLMKLPVLRTNIPATGKAVIRTPESHSLNAQGPVRTR
jgi:hypothetical protein